MDYKRLALPIGALLAAIIFLFWYNSPKRVLVRKTQQLVERVNVSSGGNAMGAGMARDKFIKFLAEEVTLETPEKEAQGTFSKEDLGNQFGGFCYYVKSASFTPQEMEVSISDSVGEVKTTIDYEVVITDKDTRKKSADSIFFWSKIDGEWKVTKVVLSD